LPRWGFSRRSEHPDSIFRGDREQSHGYDPDAAKRLQAVEQKIENIWKAIEDGLTDTDRANARLDALAKDREKLLGSSLDLGEPPQIDVEAAMTYRRQTEKVLAQGGPTEQKQIIRTWMSEMKLAPERLEVEMTYRIPEPVMHSVVAGAGFVPDSYSEFPPLVAARWVYAPAKQGAREMRRIEFAA